MRALRIQALCVLALFGVAGCEIFLPDWWGEDGEPCDEDTQCASGYECTGPVYLETDHWICRPEGFGDEHNWDGATGYDPCGEYDMAQTCTFFSSEQPCRCSTGCDSNAMCAERWYGAVCLANNNGDFHCGLPEWTEGVGILCGPEETCDRHQAGLSCQRFQNAGEPIQVCTRTCDQQNQCPQGIACNTDPALQGYCANDGWLDLGCNPTAPEADRCPTELPVCTKFYESLGPSPVSTPRCTKECAAHAECAAGWMCTLTMEDAVAGADIGPYCAQESWTTGFGELCDSPNNDCARGVLNRCKALEGPNPPLQACVKECVGTTGCDSVDPMTCLQKTGGNYCGFEGW